MLHDIRFFRRQIDPFVLLRNSRYDAMLVGRDSFVNAEAEVRSVKSRIRYWGHQVILFFNRTQFPTFLDCYVATKW